MSSTNPTLRRIRADIRELTLSPSPMYSARPLESDMFLWHFTIRGPPGTDFEGGTYHGKIILPPDYPFKPPNIVFLTPTGRFQVNTKICLSISAYHPEMWQPAWGIRLILEAVVSFMPTRGEGAIGAIECRPEERRRLAKLSNDWVCSCCGRAGDLVAPLPEGEVEVKDDIKRELAKLHLHGLGADEKSKDTDTAAPAVGGEGEGTDVQDAVGTDEGAAEDQQQESSSSSADDNAGSDEGVRREAKRDSEGEGPTSGDAEPLLCEETTEAAEHIAPTGSSQGHDTSSPASNSTHAAPAAQRHPSARGQKPVYWDHSDPLVQVIDLIGVLLFVWFLKVCTEAYLDISAFLRGETVYM